MTIVKDMALTREEYLRGLEVALQGLEYGVEGTVATTGSADRGITITLTALPPRRLSGLLSLPRAEVRLLFRGYSEAERAEFLSTFDRAFQRGGG